MCMLILYELKLKIPRNNSDIIKMYKHATDKMEKSGTYTPTYFWSEKKNDIKSNGQVFIYI